MGNDPVAELLVAVAAQDREAFRHLYFGVSDKLLGVLMRMLGTRGEAEDALQEIFIRVWLRAGQFDATRGRGMTWLHSLARHQAIDRIRSRPWLEYDNTAIDLVLDTTLSAETRMIAIGDVRRMQTCLGCLTATEAAMVRGAYLGGHSYLNLAHSFDMPLNTVRTTLRRSLHKVRECMARGTV